MQAADVIVLGFYSHRGPFPVQGPPVLSAYVNTILVVISVPPGPWPSQVLLGSSFQRQATCELM